MNVVVVVAGGANPPPAVALPLGAQVVAADSGVEVAAALGSAVDLAVGDFDSISVDGLAGLGAVERHPLAKDASDLELALAAALRLEPDRIIVVGGAAGRLDHLLGSLLLLAAEVYAGVGGMRSLGLPPSTSCGRSGGCAAPLVS